MPERHTDAAAVPVPDAGDDTLRTELARIIKMQIVSGHPDAVRPLPLADALLPLIRAHVANRPPTQWAYDQVCKALHKHRERAEKAEAALARVDALRPRTASGMVRDFVPYADIRAVLDGTEATNGTR